MPLNSTHARCDVCASYVSRHLRMHEVIAAVHTPTACCYMPGRRWVTRGLQLCSRLACISMSRRCSCAQQRKLAGCPPLGVPLAVGCAQSRLLCSAHWVFTQPLQAHLGQKLRPFCLMQTPCNMRMTHRRLLRAAKQLQVCLQAARVGEHHAYCPEQNRPGGGTDGHGGPRCGNMRHPGPRGLDPRWHCWCARHRTCLPPFGLTVIILSNTDAPTSCFVHATLQGVRVLHAADRGTGIPEQRGA